MKLITDNRFVVFGQTNQGMKNISNKLNLIIPNHLQIETVNGMCTSRCTICTYKKWERKPQIMSYDTYKLIIDKFLPHKDHIKYVTLHGFGEPLLDKDLYKKIK